MDREQEFLGLFPDTMRPGFKKVAARLKQIQEIRLRVGKPIIIYAHGREYFLSGDGELLYQADRAICPDKFYMDRLFAHLCGYSVYAYEDEIRQGFLTVVGGHRIGLGGEVVCREHEPVSMKNVNAMNIRIAHQIKGAASGVMPYLFQGEAFLNTLIISPPGSGKTTLLRDMIRCLSDGCCGHAGMTVGVVDERSEIGGSSAGVPQNDLGMRTDLLDACPKAEGMFLLLRSMNPRVIAVDEIGGKEDADAIGQASRCGCKIIATVHGNDMEQLAERKYIGELLKDGLFERYILLKGALRPGVIAGVFDGSFAPLSGTA
ncbi:MAG: stage III sporulation protein AA [Clostridium sp.]|nr:stage III sporulation protein AA [Clostridium sp.]